MVVPSIFYYILCNFSLGEEYQGISDKALKSPINTAELMALISYVNDVEATILPEMEDRLRIVLTYMLFLSDHAIFTPIELKQNNITFLWYLRMPKIIEEHRQLVDIKMEEFQGSLAQRIQKFIEDLEVYAKMVDELQHNGNIDDLPRYYKKATQLDNR